jgi:hypothetical protein
MLGEQLNLYKQFEEADASKVIKEKPESDLELLDAKTIYDLIQAGKFNNLEDFASYKKQIDFCKKRYQDFNEQLQLMPPGPEKDKLYWLIVNPDSQEEKKYQGLATLFIRYKEVARGKAEKIVPRKYTNENLKKPHNIRQISDDDVSTNDDRPDPYGDIYPFSRNLSSKRR